MEDVDLISAAYRRRSFARLGRVFLVAGLASGFALSSAMAQEAPAGAAKNDISGWVKICKKGEESGGKEVCLVKYEELDPRSGSVLLTAAVRTIEHEDGPKLIIQVPTSYALVIPAGVQAKVDEDQPVPLQFGICLPTGCQAEVALSNEMLQKMIKGNKLIIAAVNMQQKTMFFGIPLTGFHKTWTGAPVDNQKYEAARYHMLEFARKTARQQRAAQQPGAQIQAGGTAAPQAAPEASTTVPKGSPAPAPQ
jgi:invasion protein IalB